MFNPYFTQMLNPAYLDVIDCPYLNYAKTPTEIDKPIPEVKKYNVPEENVSNFIDSLKYDWESLPQEIKDEYYFKLNELLNNENKTRKVLLKENLKENFSNWDIIFLILIITIVISGGVIFYYISQGW